MLDLDGLAEKRARDLNQQQDGWKSAVWHASFQKISQSMTDGEVIAFLGLCPSPSQFCQVAAYLETQARKTGALPFSILKNEAANAGITLIDWVGRFQAKSE